ncbi:hypothetical protein SLA2020_364310 [Shorea laevis]
MASSSPSMSTPPPSSSPSLQTPLLPLDQGSGGPAVTTLSTVHQDIIQTHILTRLDGPTLAAISCASSQLHGLSTEENLWRSICAATWPSVNHPRVHEVISTFCSGHRSLFSDSFPLLDYHPPKRQKPNFSANLTTELISAVDIYYQNKLIFSKVQEMETVTEWFKCSPFRLDLLDPKESVQTSIQCFGEEEMWLEHLEENMSLSWIMIDPTRKRAGNMSSRRPVSVERHWLTGEVLARYSVILAGRESSSKELVECTVVVTCGSEQLGGGGMHVREVSMQMVDMEGKGLNGAEGLAILEGAMGGGRRRKMKGNEGKEKYEEFEERKRRRRERKQREERALDMVCIALGLIGMVAFWWSILCRK